MKEKSIKKRIYGLVFALLLSVTCVLFMPTMRIAPASAEADPVPTLSLDAAFSDEGMATEIDCAYGKKLTVPNPVALVNGQRIEAKTRVEYLAADGWEEYALPENRVLTVGDANSGDENKVAMYIVTFWAEHNGNKTELVYTVYAGLQFSNRTAWATSEAVGFVGEQMSVPTTKIQYKYKNEANRNVTVAIEPEFTFTYFSNDGGDGQVIDLDGPSFVPEKAGRYEATYSTPEIVEHDGTVCIRGSRSLTRVINIYEERRNPIGDEDGVYECAFIVGGTSDTGKGMIASSCSSKIRIDKLNGLYYMHFTQTAANYMFNLKMTADGKALGNLVVREEQVGAQNIREYIVTTDENMLKGEIAVSMYIGPMSRDVDFTIKADIDNAYRISDNVADSAERPALYVPIISANSGTIIKVLGATVEIPIATAKLGDEDCPVSVGVYYNGDTKEDIAVVDNTFTPQKTGTYYIVYTAASNSYLTSAGNPSTAVFERQVMIGKSGEVTPTDPDENKPDDGDGAEQPKENGNGGNETKIWVAAGCSVGAVVVIAVGFLIWLLARKKK